MNIKQLVIEFMTVFAAALAAGALVTLLWNLVRHDEMAVDWGTAFSLAIMFGIVLTWTKSRKETSDEYGPSAIAALSAKQPELEN